MNFPDHIKLLLKLYSEDNPLYLVGGAVRDAVLRRPYSDFDIVCTQKTREIARHYAALTDSAFFVLDEERDTCRVLAKAAGETVTCVDFAALRGGSIDADLFERDFTINAMAFDLTQADRIIDPTKGGRDLLEKWLRPVKPTSLHDDPVRTIRAIRYASDLGLRIEPETISLIQSAADLLDKVSTERKRDEVIKILEGKNVPAGIHLLGHLGLFEKIPLSGATDLHAAIGLARTLEEVIAWISGCKPINQQAALYQVTLLTRLSRFSDYLKPHFSKRNSTGHSRKALLHLASLAGDEANLVSIQLGLSREESRYIEVLSQAKSRISSLLQAGQHLEDVDVYRYFKTTNSTGIDLAIIEIARYAARIGAEFSPVEWEDLVRVCESLIEAWYEHPDVINPILPVDGNDLMEVLGCEPGPIIGECLEALREECIRLAGFTRQQALDWAHGWFADLHKIYPPSLGENQQ